MNVSKTTSLFPPGGGGGGHDAKHYKQNLSPGVYSPFDTHSKSTPNVALYLDSQVRAERVFPFGKSE